jgi:mannose-6-phosphate isomerase-like protein (cupin superfamily)
MSESSPKVNSGEKYFIRPDDVPPYHPANHSGTTNRRVICTETVGAQRMEVLLGTVERGQGALPHLHPHIEQCCYIISGRARVEVGNQSSELGPGDFCFFPPGEKHLLVSVADEPLQVLVIYSPPYNENPLEVVRFND